MKYNESIADSSVWITATPSAAALTLPFYAMEAGHFMADGDYCVTRDFHDSFLLLYTVNGAGLINGKITLKNGEAVMIDCHKPHEYCSSSDEWEFLWIHLNGSGVAPFYELLYTNEVRPAVINSPQSFIFDLKSITTKSKNSDILSYLDISSRLHSLLNSMIASLLDDEHSMRRREYSRELEAVLDFIKENYAEPITIDDMVDKIHISKYHFIRIFRRVMGITPYSYLTNYRINMSKLMLRSSDMSISSIALECGFRDTSNFISHFKKHTGMNPKQYRRDFT